MTESRGSQRVAALVAAVAVLVAGFGVLAIMWATGRWTVGRGFFDYRAATWGNVLVAPGLCALLAAALTDRRLSPIAGERRWAVAGGIVFTLAAAGVQASWLASSDPVRNWTLPEPHSFTLPGWYNAVYVVVLSGLVGAAGVTVARRLRAVPDAVRDAIARQPGPAAFAAFGISFGVLLSLDSADSIDTAAGQGSTAGAVAGAATTLALLAAVLGVQRSLRPAALGSIGAAVVVALALLTHGWPS